MADEAELPELASLNLGTIQELTKSSRDTKAGSDTSDKIDTSLGTALAQLVSRLTDPLSTRLPKAQLTQLRQTLSQRLSAKFLPTWNEAEPIRGSGFRSLICTLHGGLPQELREAAKEHGVDSEMWINALAWSKVVDGQEVARKIDWEAWCDPGVVSWRCGGWKWEDAGFDPYRLNRDVIKTVWQATLPVKETTESTTTYTPSRPSYAIPIRAPTLFQIPPTPSANPLSRTDSPSLLPAASIDHVRSHTTGGYGAFSSPESDEEPKRHERAFTDGHERVPRLEFRRHDSGRRRTAHANSASTSSVDSTVSDSNSGLSQLLTPGTRPGSADVFHPEIAVIGKGNEKPERGRDPSPNTPHARERGHKTPATVTGATPAPTNSTTPTITPYDGGNVTVVGGGVKLGGASRPSSVMSAHRTPMDRDRSPSISLASRALSSAIGPNTTGAKRPRTRRRIMPTYLGSIHQPGIGGPINGVFSQFVRQPGQQYGGPGGPNVWAGQQQLQQLQQPQQQGVGVGMAPPARPAGPPVPRAVSQ